MTTALVRVDEQLRFLLHSRHRHGDVTVPADGSASLLHLVQSLGIPWTEIGELRLDGAPVPLTARPTAGATVDVRPVSRPQPLAQPRFLLDAHLGTLARRMRLLGIDTGYRNDADDDELVVEATDQGRLLLSQDRGLLCRRTLPAGGYVRGSRPDDQLADVLDRYRPPLAPWSRCPACNGLLRPVPKDEVEHLLRPGTRRSYTEFSRCLSCGRPYWRGAHASYLEGIVRRHQIGTPEAS
ncbi:MAG: hypothetical protein J2P15_12410 [Micromonosporaceae bacterium]|nr:hypothetical protein [Micromonosporaceae bacterium]